MVYNMVDNNAKPVRYSQPMGNSNNNSSLYV